MSRASADWISLAEATDILAGSNIHLRPATVGRWAREGKLQTIKLGGRRYVRRAEVRAMLRPRRRVTAESLQPGLFEEL